MFRYQGILQKINKQDTFVSPKLTDNASVLKYNITGIGFMVRIKIFS